VLARRLIAVGMALASVSAIAGCGNEYVDGAGVYSSTSTTPLPAQTATTPGQVEPEPVQSTDAGGTESSEVGQISAAQRRAVRQASVAARRFLAGYLPYSYGRRPATLIRSASAQLRRTLERDTPRVPLALQKKARPRLRGLQLSGITGQQVIMLARIDDGQSRYAALITVQRQGQRWAVSQVQ
jgi:hypothetical protein